MGDALRAHVAALTATPYDDAWQASQLEHELARLAADSGSTTLTVAEVRRLLEDLTAPRPTRSSFRTGALTVSTLVPMRSVPHRVVCLLGMDADTFPRSITVDGDDALARAPRTGERDPRAEDRQLLLDAVMSARDALVVTFAGMSEHSGQDRPPAIPVGELLDALDATAAEPVRDRVLVRQPLQPHDERLLAAAAPATFDPVALAAARSARSPGRPRRSSPGRSHRRVPTSPSTTCAASWPTRRALLDHLDVALPYDVDPPTNDIPITLGGLEKWAVGEQVVTAVLGGGSPDAVVAAERRRGSLPRATWAWRRCARSARPRSRWSSRRSPCAPTTR